MFELLYANKVQDSGRTKRPQTHRMPGPENPSVTSLDIACERVPGPSTCRLGQQTLDLDLRPFVASLVLLILRGRVVLAHYAPVSRAPPSRVLSLHQPISSLISALIFMALFPTDQRIDSGHPCPPGRNHDPVATYAPIAPLQAPNLALLSILTAED